VEHHTDIIDQLRLVEAKLAALTSTIDDHYKKKLMFGDWINEKETISMTGLSRATLLKLRQEGKITSSTISGKQVFYKMADFKALLDKHEQER
jgi:DNA-binding transcriptional regulator PaaX